MNAEHEQDLRRALAAQAAELPADVSAELLARDYRPRGAVGRAPLALAAVAVAAGAVLAISLAGLGTDPPRAFAGWSATPTPAVGDQAQRAIAACRSRLADLARRHGGETDARIHLPTHPARGPRPRLPIAPLPTRGWHAILLDTRGPYTTVVFEVDRGRAVSTCFVGSRGLASSGTGVGARPPGSVPPGQAVYRSSGSTTTLGDEGAHQFSMVVGRTGAGVTGVTVRLNDGTRVRATCANGWFLAWWPGSHGLSATEVTTAAGTKVQ